MTRNINDDSKSSQITTIAFLKETVLKKEEKKKKGVS